jgi:hypothetical protein
LPRPHPLAVPREPLFKPFHTFLAIADLPKADDPDGNDRMIT